MCVHRQFNDQADLQQTWHRETETCFRKTTLDPGPSQHEGLGGEADQHFAEHRRRWHETIRQRTSLCPHVLV